MVLYPVFILGVFRFCLHLLHKYRPNRRNTTNCPNFGSRCNFPAAVQLLSPVQLFATPWTAARQASLSFTISRSSLKLMFIESVRPSNYLFRCCPLLLLPSVFPSIRVFSNELALHIRWLKYWSFSISPSKE